MSLPDVGTAILGLMLFVFVFVNQKLMGWLVEAHDRERRTLMKLLVLKGALRNMGWTVEEVRETDEERLIVRRLEGGGE